MRICHSVVCCGQQIALLTTLAATMFLATSTTSAQTPVKCLNKTFTYYPGSTLGKLRYGRAEFTFLVCTDKAPADWKATATVKTNSTGKNLGINFDSAAITLDGNPGTSYAFYKGTFNSASCLPGVRIGCYGSGRWTVRFAASNVREINAHGDTVPDPSVVELGKSPPDQGLTLYDSP